MRSESAGTRAAGVRLSLPVFVATALAALCFAGFALIYVFGVIS